MQCHAHLHSVVSAAAPFTTNHSMLPKVGGSGGGVCTHASCFTEVKCCNLSPTKKPTLETLPIATNILCASALTRRGIHVATFSTTGSMGNKF